MTQHAQPTEEPGPDPRVHMWIEARFLKVDQRIQREVNDEKVARIVNEFDWRRFESITVLDIGDGTFVVVEGQHRTLAVQAINPRWLVSSMIIPAADEEEQAQIALDIVQGRGSHTAFEKWRQRLHAGHPHELMAEEIFRRHGVRLGKRPSAMTISAAATLRRIVHGGNFSPAYGSALLDRTLGVLIVAFPTYDHESNVTRWDPNIMLTVANLLIRNEDIDDQALALSLKVRPAIQWVNIGRSNDDGPAWQRIYRAVVTEYNHGKRKGRVQ